MSRQWNLPVIQQYITNGVQENLALEYKAGDALGKSEGKTKEITKDISAMANSSGGILIYGIKEFDDANQRHLPERIDPVDQAQFSKEWLEQIINNIRPRIHGFLYIQSPKAACQIMLSTLLKCLKALLHIRQLTGDITEGSIFNVSQWKTMKLGTS